MLSVYITNRWTLESYGKNINNEYYVPSGVCDPTLHLVAIAWIVDGQCHVAILQRSHSLGLTLRLVIWYTRYNIAKNSLFYPIYAIIKL